MPSYDSNFFNVNPYYDDFDEDKRFLKMLFRPGYALQARELTQIQSILQNQIERFGNFVLDDGSMVFGGQITEIPTKVVSLSGLTGGGGIKVEGLKDKVVSLFASGTTSYAKIIHGTKNPLTNEDVIYYQYMSGTTASGSLSVQGFNTGITFTASTSGNSVNGLVVFVDQGIRYTNGYFVSHPAQRIGVYQEGVSTVDFETPDSSVGFNVKKSIVTHQEDISLRDPASGFYNFNAPGSDRFKIELEIAQRGITASVDTSSTDILSRTDFIEFIRVVDGDVVKKEKYPDLGEIEETFARRTYDESGHYVVDPFEITMTIGPTATQLRSKLDSGKAYIFGYEFETVGTTKLTHERAREFRDGNDDVQYGYSVGPFILAEFANLTGGASGFNISENPLVLFDSSNGLTTSQSTAVDGVRFVVGEYATTNVFVPGATLYFGSNEASLTTSAGASAHITARILRVVGTSTQFTTIEIGPPYATGNGWTGGFTSSFATTSPFYVAAGPSYEAGTNLNTYTGSNVSFFNTVSAYSFTGGNLSSGIGSARVRNIQKLSGDTHKLFLDQLSMNAGKSVSDMKRIYVSGNTGNPAFYAAEIPTKIYNVENTSLVFESPFAEVVKNIDQYDFMVDVALGVTFASESWSETLSFNGLVQIGPNIASSDVFYDMNSSQIVTAYCNGGKIEGELRINGGANPKTITIQNATLNGVAYNGPATVVVSCMVDTEKRTKTGATASISLSFTGPDSQGYYYSYLNSGGSYLTDVYEVTSLNPGLTGYVFDNGQRDTYYDFARIKYSSLPAGSHTAYIKYYTHGGYGPFIGGETGSYPSYENIPSFISSSGKTISLRNSLDFRAVRTGATGSFTLVGPYAYPSFVYDGYEHSVDYSYYLPRIDKIVLTRDKQFQVIKGVPSETPVAPADNPNAMTLYTIRFNPYTFNENDVSIVQEDNRRFTMKDIGNLERRIEKLEYYSTLSLLEQEAKNSAVYDNNGFEISKKAILVDQFTGTESSDVGNPDFHCSINRETKELRPPLEMYNVGYENIANVSLEAGLTNNDDVVLYNYTEEEFVANKKYNSSRHINSNAIVDFNGTLKLSPNCDPWFSTTKAPIIKSNAEGENDSWLIGSASFSMNSSFWDYNWFGKNTAANKVERKNTTLVKNYKSRSLKTDKIGTFTIPQSNISSTPERILDSTIVPYARSKTVTVTATGLMPNRLHYVYFDDELKTPVGSGITSSDKGELTYSLSISGDTHVAGRKLVRVMDVSNNDLSSCTSSADAIYTVSGITKDIDSTRLIRPLITKRESSSSENVVNDVLTREFQRKSVKSKLAKENISQMFTVSNNEYSLGLFVSSIQIYFTAWPLGDFEKNIPVKLMIKPVINGFPNPSKIISEAIVYDVESDTGFEDVDEGYKLVKFKFSHPVYLEPGDYAVELETNSSSYAVKTYSLPSVNLESSVERENVVDTSFGSLILPKNVGNTEKLTNEIMSMIINKCNFGSSSAKDITYSSLSLNYPAEIRSHLEGALLDNRYCSVVCNNVTYAPNTTETIKDAFSLSSVRVRLGYIDTNVCPAYDLRSSNVLFARYKMSNSTTQEKSPRETNTVSDSEYRNLIRSRYITKTVNTLQSATNVSVTFDKNQPPGTGIHVYLKRTEPNSSVSFDDAPYIELTQTSDEIDAVTSDEYVKVEYRNPVNLAEFNTFAVKVVFTAPSTSNRYPSIKNLRVVAI